MFHIFGALIRRFVIASRKSEIYRFKTVQDRNLLNVWLGNEAYLSKPKKRREDEPSINSIDEIIGPDFDLVILTVGHIQYRNIAAPGVLKEALMLRKSARKSTWVIENPDSPFTTGNHSYSYEVKEYIDNNFELIDLSSSTTTEAGKPPAPPPAPRNYYEVQDPGLTSSSHDEDFGALGMGKTKYKKGKNWK